MSTTAWAGDGLNSKMAQLALAAVVTACVAAPALAAEPAVDGLPNELLLCPEDTPELDRWSYLRSLSLHLRGTIPTVDEYEVLDALDTVPEALLDEWLASDDFVDQVVRHHRELLWPNVTNVNLVSAAFGLRREPGSLTYWRIQPATEYRGADVPCLDEPAEFTETGAIKTTWVDGANREGYVWIAPYWDPDVPIKVCAFDAATNQYGLSGIYCGSRSAPASDPSCGCGEGLRFCRYSNRHRPVLEAFGRDVELRIQAVIANNEPYSELFTSERAYVNGPIVHYLTHQAQGFANVRFDPLAIEPATLPALEFHQADEWHEIELPSQHAGVLTSPGYLMRFQTDRARANRFYDAFLCQPFNPPAGGISIGGETLPHPDLQERSGCKYCHALLEPAAAYWGRWAEGGTGYINPFDFPPVRPDCTTCAYDNVGCSEDCNRFYLKDALSAEEGEYLGMLKPYVFRRQEHTVNVEVGPELLVGKTVVDGRLPRCVAKRTASWLLGREPVEDEGEWIEDLAEGFVTEGMSYRSLVKSIVTSDVYRRVR